MRVDFTQTAADHGKVNVLMCPVGEQLSEDFLTWIEQSVVNCVRTHFSPSRYGCVALRVLRSAPKQSDELWGDFLFHRRLHGVIGISNCKDAEQVQRVADVFSALSSSYPRALHSCLLVTAPGASEAVQAATADSDGPWPLVVPLDVESEVWLSAGASAADPQGSLFLRFLEGFADAMRDKMLNMCRERGDCRSEGVLLRAPPEMHGNTVDDTRSTNRKKRCMGRLMKQQGDLLMLAGETVAAVAWYTEAYEVLKGITDSLWMGGALLGYSCAFHRLRYQVERAEAAGEILNPLMEGLSIPTSLEDSSSSSSSVLRSGDDPHQRSPSPSGGRYDHRGIESSGRKSTSPSPGPIRDLSGSSTAGSMLRAMGTSSTTVVGGITVRRIMLSDNWARRKTAVTVDTGIREAIGQLTKVEGAALFESECCLLLVRLLMELKRNTDAACLLSETMSVNYGLDFSEKLVMLITSGKLFRLMGFERKAAFAFRLAALQRVRSKHPSMTAWKEAYMLLSNCLDGFGLENSLPKLANEHHFGWHRLQCCILRELSYLAHHSGNGVLAVSHSLVLLHAHHMHMTAHDVDDLVKQLTEMTQQIRSMNQQMRLEVLPVWLLNKLPRVRSFYPVQHPEHLTPMPIEEKVAAGPFIYSSLRAQSNLDVALEKSVVWVQGSSVEVSVELTNPLTRDLRIEKMALLTEGAAFEAVPTSVSLAPNNEPYTCVLIGIPKEAGCVTLLGYVAHIYDVEHTVQVGVTGGISREIRIAPPLPFLTVRNMLDSPDPPRRLNGAHSLSPLTRRKQLPESRLSMQQKPVSTTIPIPPMRSLPAMDDHSAIDTSGTPPPAALGKSGSHGSNASWASGDQISPLLVSGSTVLRKRKGGLQHSVYSVELSLYPGQSSSLSLLLANRGDQAVDSLRIKCTEKPQATGSGDSAPVVEWNDPVTSNLLPIQAGKSAVMPITVRLSHRHQALAPNQLDVKPSILTCHCQLYYTGDKGMAENLQRCSHVEFKINIAPLIELHELDAQPCPGSAECLMLSFLAMNLSDHDVVLAAVWVGDKKELSTPQTVPIRSLSSARIALAVPRIHLPEEQPPRAQSPSTKSGPVSLESQYMTYFADFIHLEWSNSLEMTGTFHFSGRRLQLRPHLLHNLQPETLVYDICVNGVSTLPSLQAADMPLFTPLPVEVTLTNKSDTTVEAVLLQLRLHEVLGNGYIDTELSGKCAVSGALTMPVNVLPAGQSVTLTTQITLLKRGIYTMYIRTARTDSQPPDAASTASNAVPAPLSAGVPASTLAAWSTSQSVKLCAGQ